MYLKRPSPSSGLQANRDGRVSSLWGRFLMRIWRKLLMGTGKSLGGVGVGVGVDPFPFWSCV